MGKVKGYPTLHGWRSKQPTRQENIDFLREFIEECRLRKPSSIEEIEIQKLDLSELSESLARNEGDLGQAWNQAAHVLSVALRNPVIKKNPVTVELLEIVHSLAATAGCDEEYDIDLLLADLGDVFASKIAWAKAANKNSEARNWVAEEWRNRSDAIESKKNFADRYSELIRRKFKNSSGKALVIDAQTIERTWLPKTKNK